MEMGLNDRYKYIKDCTFPLLELGGRHKCCDIDIYVHCCQTVDRSYDKGLSQM